MKVKLYTDLSLLQHGFPVEILIPFIGTFNKEDELGSVMYGRFDDYFRRGKEFIELTSKEECDACLLPINYDVVDHMELKQSTVQHFLREAEETGKPILIFAGHDVSEFTISVKNAIIFNSAVHKSKKPSNVYSWPHFFEDYLKKYGGGKVVPRMKGNIPVIGFCGYAPPFKTRWGREKLIGLLKLIGNFTGILQQKFPSKISHSYRARALMGLLRSKKVVTNLRLKSNFAFGPQGQMNTGNSSESHETFRRNFVNNILESDYTLCVRGIGNNSVRFFETLCCGRIPVFVNTDSCLPFEEMIDWKSLCVWVEEKDIDHIGEKVSAFHNNISDEEFSNLQIKLRGIWEQYLSPVGFFSNLGLIINHLSS